MTLSTIRSATDPTIAESSTARGPISCGNVVKEWLQSGSPDLVETLRQRPELLRDRSLLLELAVVEFQARRLLTDGMDLEQYCQRFEEFGSSIRGPIYKQLAAQRFIDDHPELLEVLSTPRWPKAGDEVENFQVVEEMGFGATAHVYLCRQQDVGGREVVVKTTPFSSFEASILGRLSHPNIVPIYSTGFISDCNLHYLCMPFCGRSTLSDLLDVAFQDGLPRRDDAIAIAAKRWMPDEQQPANHWQQLRAVGLCCRTYVDGIIGLAVQISDALLCAHEQHILHGDLKPSNVLLTPSAKPLLLDFNLSQDYASSAAMCGGGTLPYMPPEHLRFVAGNMSPIEKATFDPTPDVYSFGALIYELLTGVTPVSLPSKVDDLSGVAEFLVRQIEGGPPPIQERNPLVSRRLELLILSCLACDKNGRPASMLEVNRRLRAEMRFLASVSRMTRVRPLLCASAIGIPLAILAGASAYLAGQPPRYLDAYEQGLQLASQGELDGAIEQFTNSIELQPTYVPPRFELARLRLARGDLDPAMNDFHLLVRTKNDAHSMAYLGYCFNLQKVPGGAIEWYKLAIHNGATSAAIYNNLGASYLDASTRMRYIQQVLVAEEYLLKAYELEPTSITIKLNIVRSAEARAKLDPLFDPSAVWRHAYAIVQSDDPLVQLHLAGWYQTVLHWEVTHGSPDHTAEMSDSAFDKSARQVFGALHRMTGPRNHDGNSETYPPPIAEGDNSSPPPSYFLEPHSLIAGPR